MKKIFLLIVVGVVALAGGVGLAALTSGTGGKTLCVEGFNYKTNLSLAEYQTSPTDAIIGVYKNKQLWLYLYPIGKLSNAMAQGYDMTAPAFTTKAGWKVYAPLPTAPRGTHSYAIDSDMPFLVMGDPAVVTDDEVRAFLNNLKPGRCPSPNPGLYDEFVESADDEVYQTPTGEEMVALCSGLKMTILETRCVNPGPSFGDPSLIVYDVLARVKNDGLIPVRGISVNVVYEKGNKSGAFFNVTIEPGAEQWIAPRFPVGTKNTNALDLTPKPDRMTFCPDVSVRAPLDCAE